MEKNIEIGKAGSGRLKTATRIIVIINPIIIEIKQNVTVIAFN